MLFYEEYQQTDLHYYNPQLVNVIFINRTARYFIGFLRFLITVNFWFATRSFRNR